MKRGVKVAFCLASGLAMAGVARAGDTVAPGDPYATVIERNIFGLNPPQPITTNPQDANPPAKITPNGIMDILGELQVLFKVAQPPKPGNPATPEETYILSEGQRQDDIEVVKIDQKNSVVTFNNHGETQTLPLVTTMPASTPATAPAAPGGPGGPGGRFSPGFVNPGGGPGGRPRSGGVGYGGAGVNGNSGGNSGGVGGANYGASSGNPGIAPSLGGAPTHSNIFNAASQIPEGMTEEVQTIAIEANRLQAQQEQPGEPDIYPITELTPQPNSGSPQ